MSECTKYFIVFSNIASNDQDLRPTPSFTNFSITLLVLFFLQKKYNILPPLRDLQRLAGKDKFPHACPNSALLKNFNFKVL